MSLTYECWFCAEVWKRSSLKTLILEHFEVCNMLVVDHLTFSEFSHLSTSSILPNRISFSFILYLKTKVFFSPPELTAYSIYNQNLFLYLICDLSSAFKQICLSHWYIPNLKVIDSSLTFPELFALLKEDVF